MKKLLALVFLGTIIFLGFGVNTANACYIEGRIYCDVNKSGTIDEGDTPFAGVLVTLKSNGTIVGTATTDSNGYYKINIYDYPASYEVIVDKATLPGDAIFVSPTSNSITFSNSWADYPFAEPFISTDWVISSALCKPGGCWLTGGGAKIEPITRLPLAERTKFINFGGNVFPSCSGIPGNGGNWTNIDKNLKIHVQVTSFSEVTCGNVEDHEPGSTSPKTPFNYLEAYGQGVLKGISGLKQYHGIDLPFEPVYVFFRAEDRNEPGNEKASGGAYIDKYFINVYTNPADPVGSSIYLVSGSTDPSVVQPLTITDGNLQIHISSCP